MPPKVSVIVPVYNVEQYIEKCLHSLFGQTLKEMEFIFVDDFSTDRSVDIITEVLNKYPGRLGQVRIIIHKTNQGVAAARTSAMKAMRGEYMANCDADDWIDPEAYEKMYAAAKSKDADMVTCKYIDHYPDGQQTERGVAFTGKAIDDLLQGQYTYGLWDKIIRTAIIQDNDIYPFPGINYNEDLNVIVRALCYSKKVTGLTDAFYHHLQNRVGSICYGDQREKIMTQSVPSMRLLDEFLDTFGKEHDNPKISPRLTDPLKFWMKLGYYQTGDFKTWRALWPESRRVIPKMKKLSTKERLLMMIRTLPL